MTFAYPPQPPSYASSSYAGTTSLLSRFTLLAQFYFVLLTPSYLFCDLQADPSKPVLVAGDPERAHVSKVEKEDGINYHINQIKDSVSL